SRRFRLPGASALTRAVCTDDDAVGSSEKSSIQSRYFTSACARALEPPPEDTPAQFVPIALDVPVSLVSASKIVTSTVLTLPLSLAPENRCVSEKLWPFCMPCCDSTDPRPVTVIGCPTPRPELSLN